MAGSRWAGEGWEGRGGGGEGGKREGMRVEKERCGMWERWRGVGECSKFSQLSDISGVVAMVSNAGGVWDSNLDKHKRIAHSRVECKNVCQYVRGKAC